MKTRLILAALAVALLPSCAELAENGRLFRAAASAGRESNRATKAMYKAEKDYTAGRITYAEFFNACQRQKNSFKSYLAASEAYNPASEKAAYAYLRCVNASNRFFY